MRLHSDIVDLIKNPETPWYVIVDAVREKAPNMASIYLVEGQCEAYSDECSWIVAAFLEEEKANDLCTRLQEWAARHNDLDYEERSSDITELDPFSKKYNYSGDIRYIMFAAPLKV